MLRQPRAMREAPLLDPTPPTRAPTPRHALLINPFYPKDPHASFGKHVLTPTLALTSLAAATPPSAVSATTVPGWLTPPSSSPISRSSSASTSCPTRAPPNTRPPEASS